MSENALSVESPTQYVSAVLDATKLCIVKLAISNGMLVDIERFTLSKELDMGKCLFNH